MKKTVQQQHNKHTKDRLQILVQTDFKPDEYTKVENQEYFFYTEESDSSISYGDPALAPEELKKKKARKAQ